MLSRSQFVFKVIDVVMYNMQNGISFQNIECVKDVIYKPDGGIANSGNIYYDKNMAAAGRKFPVILNIHGGGFVMGDKDFRWSLSEFYAHNGYFVFNINHRLSPEAVFPENCNDCVDALNYLSVLAQDYNIDLDKVIITGDSSGAYLATYVTAMAFDDELREKIGGHEVKIKPAALASFCGIYDMDTVLHRPIPFGIMQDVATQFMGMKVKRDMSNVYDFEFFDYLSPSGFVNEKWCPVFIVWSDEDLICVGQGDVMEKILQEKCPNVGSYHCAGLMNNHCYHLTYRTKPAKKTMAAFLRFMKSIDLY